MISVVKRTSLLILLLAGFAISQARIQRLYTPAYPHFKELIPNVNSFQDATFIVLGFRALAADVAWVQLLQNMGGAENAENKGNLPLLKNDTLRVTRIDPWFVRAYLFGSALLAWMHNTGRADEALEVLAEGIKYNPDEWSFRTYAAGIGYMKNNEMDKMIRMLEDAVHDPKCPATVKSILANAYKAQKRYADAIAIWEDVLSTPSARDYHLRARTELSKLHALLGR